MKAFIVNGVEKRSKHVKEYYKDVGVYDYFENIEVLNTYKHDDFFIEWVHEVLAPHVSKHTLAGYFNWCDCMIRGMEYDHFVIIQDDVVFPKEWKTYFDNIKPGFFECVSIGVNFHILPDGKKTVTGNIGGCECVIVSKEFADFFLNNIDFRQASDIVTSAILLLKGHRLEITAICQQTSFLEKQSSSLNHQETKYEKQWIEFVNTYKPTNLSIFKIKHEFQEFLKIKKIVEVDFLKTFGVNIDIHNIRYIIERYNSLKNIIFLL